MKKTPPISHRLLSICIFTFHTGHQKLIQISVNLISQIVSKQSSTTLLIHYSTGCSTQGFSKVDSERRGPVHNILHSGYHQCKGVGILSPSLLNIPTIFSH